MNREAILFVAKIATNCGEKCNSSDVLRIEKFRIFADYYSPTVAPDTNQGFE
jgi:hypothetical protein